MCFTHVSQEVEHMLFFKMQSLSIVEWTAIQSFSTAEATPTWQVRINKYSLITSLDIPLLMNGWLT